jgi:hypothetical protein
MLMPSARLPGFAFYPLGSTVFNDYCMRQCRCGGTTAPRGGLPTGRRRLEGVTSGRAGDHRHTQTYVASTPGVPPPSSVPARGRIE